MFLWDWTAVGTGHDRNLFQYYMLLSNIIYRNSEIIGTTYKTFKDQNSRSITEMQLILTTSWIL